MDTLQEMQKLHALAQEIVDTAPVITTYAACEWQELHDDGRVWITAIVREAIERSRAAELRAALEAARLTEWVHNAAITNDIEALRRICLAYSRWWNDIAAPALAKASESEA